MGHRQPGGDLIVVLDGGAERLARVDQFRQLFPLQQPEQLLQGDDTATQITALADWLRRRQAQPPQRIWIATDQEHSARATLLVRIALAGRGIQIQPDPPPTPSQGERRKLVCDALRMSLWRATGSMGGWLVPLPLPANGCSVACMGAAARGSEGRCALPAAALRPAAS